jgi:chromosome segregation ATPase
MDEDGALAPQLERVAVARAACVEDHTHRYSKEQIKGIEDFILQHVDAAIDSRLNWPKLTKGLEHQIHSVFRREFSNIILEMEKRVVSSLRSKGHSPQVTSSAAQHDAPSCAPAAQDLSQLSERLNSLASRIEDVSGEVATLNRALHAEDGLRWRLFELTQRLDRVENAQADEFRTAVQNLSRQVDELREAIPAKVQEVFLRENERFEAKFFSRVRKAFDGQFQALRDRIYEIESTHRALRELMSDTARAQHWTQNQVAQLLKKDYDKALAELTTEVRRASHSLASSLARQEQSLKVVSSSPEVEALKAQVHAFHRTVQRLEAEQTTRTKEARVLAARLKDLKAPQLGDVTKSDDLKQLETHVRAALSQMEARYDEGLSSLVLEMTSYVDTQLRGLAHDSRSAAAADERQETETLLSASCSDPDQGPPHV